MFRSVAFDISEEHETRHSQLGAWEQCSTPLGLPSGSAEAILNQLENQAVNLSPVGTPAVKLLPLGTPARKRSPLRMPTGKLSPLGTPARKLSPLGSPAGKLSPLGSPAGKLSPLGTPVGKLSPLEPTAGGGLCPLAGQAVQHASREEMLGLLRKAMDAACTNIFPGLPR